MRVTLGLFVILGVPLIAAAQDDPLVGAVVLPRSPEVELRTEDGASLGPWRASAARVAKVAPSGRVFVVNLYPAGSGGSWTRRADVVKLADAVAHFGGYIRNEADDPWGYDMRAQAYSQLREHAKAAADLTEAIRLEPSADRYVVRGNQYSDLKENAKAIADYTAALRLDPNDYYALVNRGRVRSLAGDGAKAETDLNKAARLRPGDPIAFNERGLMWDRRGEFDRAVTDFTEAIRLNKTFAEAFANRGYAEMGRRDHAAAVDDYTRAIRLVPTNADYRYHRGFANVVLKETEMALVDFAEATRLNPADPRPYISRGDIRRQQKDTEKAIAEYTGAIRAAPKAVDGYVRRAGVWDTAGDFGKAIPDYEEAIRVAPEVQQPYNALAWIRATCPEAKHRDGTKAVALATKLCELSAGKVADHLDTLAAAQAEAGDFDDAVATQKRALALPGTAEALTREYRERLKLYEAERPFRQPARAKKQ
ncbi:MAG TPA: tetratricopeptide repeat protein [Urbifossiella sp.]|nr:tetratricopeptide repeat protein [Urbifossiella sp.]